MGRALPLVAVLGALIPCAGCALRYQTAPADHGGQGLSVASIEDAEIHFEELGSRDGEAVVLIHGFGSSLHSWDLLAPALARRFHVVRLDLKGFGRSSKYEGDYSPEAQARVVLGLMDRLGIERAHVVAHSMGSLVALIVALEAPQRVDRLVLTGAWVYSEQLPWSLRSAQTPGMGELIFGLWYAENLEWRFGLSFHEPDLWISEEMLVRARQTLSAPGARATALATVRAFELSSRHERFGGVTSETLLIHGRDDRVALPAYGERLAAQLRSARLEVLPYCGHFPMLEQSGQFTDLVIDWLEARP